MGDQQWSTIFQDPVLKRLVAEALQNNLDLRVAAQRVLEAQAQVGITRSQQLPSVSGGGSYSALQIPSSLAGHNSDGSCCERVMPTWACASRTRCAATRRSRLFCK